MKILKVLALSALVACVAASNAFAEYGQYQRSGHIKVMTQNQYLGADLTPIVGATDPVEFNAAVIAALQEIAGNRFQERVQALTKAISTRRPHIVGLQEVYEFTCEDFGNGNCALFQGAFNDHLAATMDALAQQHSNYYVAATIENLTLPPPGLPFPGLPVHLDADGVPDLFVGVVDRDVILARRDIQTSNVDFGCVRPSQDGCHFETIAQAMTLIGPINIERGFLAVDARVKGKLFRVVNTHLEVQSPSPDPLSPAIQAAQASELIGTMSLLPPEEGRRLIVVGDINSSPDDTRFPHPTEGPFFTPYQQFVNGTDLFGNPISLAYTDIWTLNYRDRPGYTCCQDSDLMNQQSALTERIDMIFSLEAPRKAHSRVIGRHPWNKTPSGLWPSDHGTVVGRLIY
jgi:endonuclease/exonuclease/phosphatase family metal-dependent hydrolase